MISMNVHRIDKATGEVVNTEVWGELPEDTAEHAFVVQEGAGIGWSLVDGVLVPPPSAPPPPPPRRLIPKSVVQERAYAIGKLDDLMTALQANSLYFGRWFAPNWPEVYADDEGLLEMLSAVGCTPEQIAEVTAP